MRQTLIVGFVLFMCMNIKSQTDFQNQFNEFRQDTRQQYSSYKDSINNVFAKYLEVSWIQFKVNTPIPSPKKPLPQMDIAVPKEEKESVGLQIDSIVRQKESWDDFQLWESSQSDKIGMKKMIVSFYGSELLFHYSPEYAMSLVDLEEKTIAKAWKQIAASPYQSLLNELLFYRNDMNLNDWAMFRLLNAITETFFQKEKAYQVVFSTFLMNQLGFRVKIGRSHNQLIHLVSFQTTVYGVPFIHFENERFYVLGESSNGIYSYTIDYPKTDKHVNLQMKRPLRLTLSLQTKKLKVNNMVYSININENLISLFQTCPQTEISVYANSPISNLTRKSLEKELLPQLTEKTEEEAVNFLLDFVQTAFEYKNDWEQFGGEKFFFTEELFYYPYSDCEDRSVLFSQLVRRFLGLQVVLLDYPDHVTTAVKFNHTVLGDFISVQGEQYVICDPTYLHAKVGQSIPRYKNQKAKIYVLD